MKLAFTSCMDAVRVPDQPIWDQIRAEQPDVLLLLGDQIYMDWGDLGGSDWRSDFHDNPGAMLPRFARDMHRRYALQWGVASFRNLVCSLAGRADPSCLLVTWDDHDYAWNNSLGRDSTRPDLQQVYEHGVPDAVKAVSRRLFVQFVHQLRHASVDAPYPPLPADWGQPLPPADAQPLFWAGRLAGAAGLDGMLLDTRWCRDPRSGDPAVAQPSTLGAMQRQKLMDAAGQEGAGLLVVAGGVPMAHDYLISSQQDWRGSPGREPAYQDYAGLMAAARRPVLYLSGDIHRTAWSGRLPDDRQPGQSTPSRIVQLLASGAAIGSIGPKRFAPSYGCLEMAAEADGTRVDVRLMVQLEGGQWVETPPMGAALHAGRHDWQGALLGEAWDDVQEPADDLPMPVFNARAWAAGATLPCAAGQRNDLNRLFAPVAAEGAQWPDPLVLTHAAGDGFQLHAAAGAANAGDAVRMQLRAAFERASTGPVPRPVVLFIHGVGKDFGDAVAQGHALRKLYGCEPVVYAWETARVVDVTSAINALVSVQQAAAAGAVGLANLLAAFGAVARDPAFAQVPAILLARSAGSIALAHALAEVYVDWENALQPVRRMVLSAPLLKWADLRRNRGFKALRVPMVITCNQHDRTLRLADFADGFGPMTGLDAVLPVDWPHVSVADFTASPRVGILHDYLLTHLTDHSFELHRRLLSDPEFSWAQAVQDGLATQHLAAEPRIYHVG